MSSFLLPFARRRQGRPLIQIGGRKLTEVELQAERELSAHRKSHRKENEEAIRRLAEKATASMRLDEDEPLAPSKEKKP